MSGKSGLLRADETTKKGYVYPYHSPVIIYVCAVEELIFFFSNCSLPKLLIDGPYCSPAQDYRKYDIVQIGRAHV